MMPRTAVRLVLCSAIAGTPFAFPHDGAAQGTGLSFGAVMAPDARSAADLVTMFDDDKDGKISRIEARLKIVRVFSGFDKDHNDRLSPSELPNVPPDDFSRADQNRDGVLSAVEFLGADFASFDRLDANSDGFITVDELSSRMAR
jgi:hypothetical protein